MPKQWTAAGSADSIGEQLSIVKFVQWLMSAPIHRLVRLSDRIDHDSNRGVFAGVVGSTSVRRFLGATTSMASPCMRIHTALPLGAVPGSQRSSAAKATLRTTVDTIASTADKRPPKLGWKPKMYARNAANEALTSKEVMDRKPKPRTKAKPTNRARKNAPTSDSAGPALPIAFNALRKIAKTLLAPTSKVPAPSRLAHPL